MCLPDFFLSLRYVFSSFLFGRSQVCTGEIGVCFPLSPFPLLLSDKYLLSLPPLLLSDLSVPLFLPKWWRPPRWHRSGIHFMLTPFPACICRFKYLFSFSLFPRSYTQALFPVQFAIGGLFYRRPCHPEFPSFLPFFAFFLSCEVPFSHFTIFPPPIYSFFISKGDSSSPYDFFAIWQPSGGGPFSLL